MSAGPDRTEAAATTIPPWWRRLPQLALLTAVWVLLWGSVSVLTVVGGMLVAVLVIVAFPLPVLPDRMPFRPVRLLGLAGQLVRDLVVSGVQVSWVTLRYGRAATAGIVAVPVCTRSDRVATMVAAAVALSPGSFVLQLDRRRGSWYVYALGMHRPGAADRVRRETMRLQYRVVAALGTAAEIEECRRHLGEMP